ncbi:MAG TPA: type II CAAX endopeptidase family protein [Candidatus Polarisedimenticolia bacterium]|jgi:membrane protease YdiL (CAAX protease family)|nr:type II CAAX endopeptidase family protein [Candidatus Polarisedimenticolia bacterium]
MSVLELWNRVPKLIRAVVLGLLVTGTGQLPWTILVGLNIQNAPSIPWSVPLMAAYLVVWWLYLKGWGPPRSTREARRRNLRAGVPPRAVWIQSLLTAGVAGLALRMLADAARQLSPRPGQDLIPREMLAQYPFITVLCLLLGTAVVSGTVEEAAFRGYMQSTLERRYSRRAAILWVGLIFSLAHYRTEAPDPIPWLIFIPIYFAASIVFGLLASLTGSILPGLLCHVAFNACGLLQFWLAGVPRSVWEVGFGTSFWIKLGLGVLFGAAAAQLYRRLAASAAARLPVPA